MAHRAIERINQSVNESRALTFEGVVELLRGLGGLTQLISSCVAEELERLEANPRAERRLAGLEGELRSQIPEMRFVVQSAVNRLVATSGGRTNGVTSSRVQGARGPLALGYHPEVELAPPALPWIGYADAIHLTDEDCEIIDYKTGTPSPTHADQLRLYALLWYRDSVVNPTARTATRLVLVYPGSTLEVAPPVLAELHALEEEIRARTDQAARRLSTVPPMANVDPDICRYCDLKHLCADYWTSGGQARVAVAPPPHVRSMQGVVVENRGGSVTILTTQFDPYLPPATDVVVTGLNDAWRRPGQRLRLIDVRVNHEPGGQSAVVTLGPQSEVFALPATL